MWSPGWTSGGLAASSGQELSLRCDTELSAKSLCGGIN